MQKWIEAWFWKKRYYLRISGKKLEETHGN
jgi:hypothetical protein